MYDQVLMDDKSNDFDLHDPFLRSISHYYSILFIMYFLNIFWSRVRSSNATITIAPEDHQSLQRSITFIFFLFLPTPPPSSPPPSLLRPSLSSSHPRPSLLSLSHSIPSYFCPLSSRFSLFSSHAPLCSLNAPCRGHVGSWWYDPSIIRVSLITLLLWLFLCALFLFEKQKTFCREGRCSNVCCINNSFGIQVGSP